MFDLYGLDYQTQFDEGYAVATFYVNFEAFLRAEDLDALDDYDSGALTALMAYLGTYGAELGDPGWDDYDWQRVPLEVYTEGDANDLFEACLPLLRALQDPSGTFDYDVMTITGG